MVLTVVMNGQPEPSLSCCQNKTDHNQKLGRKPLSPSSHLPVSTKCPLLAEANMKAVGKGVGEKEFGELLPRVQEGGLRAERQQVSNWDRAQRKT